MNFRYVVLAGPLEESVLEEFLCFGVVAALILARPAGPLGRAFWRCIFGWLLAMPKLYHHYGLQGRRSWPQDGSNAAVRQPTRRLFFRACVAMVELQGHWGERFGGVFVFWGGCWVDSCSAAGPLGRAFWRCIFGWLLARPKLYHYGRRRWPQDGSNAAVRQPTRRLFSRVHGYG